MQLILATCVGLVLYWALVLFILRIFRNARDWDEKGEQLWRREQKFRFSIFGRHK